MFIGWVGFTLPPIPKPRIKTQKGRVTPGLFQSIIGCELLNVEKCKSDREQPACKAPQAALGSECNEQLSQIGCFGEFHGVVSGLLVRERAGDGRESA